MTNSYSSDPRNIYPVNNSATPSSGPGGTVPEIPLPTPGTPQPVSPPPAEPSASLSAASNAGGSANQRRLPPGTGLSASRYKIEKLIASGGMGAVYRAVDTRFNRPCAVKEMLDEFQNESERTLAVEWFSREATLLLDLNHPCIPRVRDFFMESGKHYLVMDFIDGRTLGEVLENEGNVVGINGAHGVPEGRARSWAQQVCSVLSYLHRQAPPIIFRDLKPSNIMVTERDEVKLIDFGIARTFQSQRQSTIIMTIGYAPPEQLHGMAEPRSDLYALGATLHRVLTHHDAANNKPSIFSFPPLRTLRPDISPAFEQVVMKALAPALEQRWSGAMDMERAVINLPPITVVPPVGPIAGGVGQRPGSPMTPANRVTPGPGARPATQGTSGTTGPAGQHLSAALAHLAAGRIEPAYAAIQQAYSLEPNNAMVHKLFGLVFARRVPPQVDLAVRAYMRSIELYRDDAETHKLLGNVFLVLSPQPPRAIPAYREALRLNPQDFEAHFLLGQCYEKTNQLDLALHEYEEATTLAPKQPAAHYQLGNLAMRMNQLPLAEKSFVQVLVINPADNNTRFLLSQVYERENKLEDAFRECSYVVGPLSANPAVQQMFQRLRAKLGR